MCHYLLLQRKPYKCYLGKNYFAGGRTLQILNAQEDNTGRYTCIATNEAGETLKHYEVKVYSKYSIAIFINIL